MNNIKELTFNDVITKYKNNEYLHRLTILYHIRELELKTNKYIAEDICPFKKQEFIKELADLYILLNMLNNFNNEFNDMVKIRKEKFINKLKEEIKT